MNIKKEDISKRKHSFQIKKKYQHSIRNTSTGVNDYRTYQRVARFNIRSNLSDAKGNQLSVILRRKITCYQHQIERFMIGPPNTTRPELLPSSIIFNVSSTTDTPFINPEINSILIEKKSLMSFLFISSTFRSLGKSPSK